MKSRLIRDFSLLATGFILVAGCESDFDFHLEAVPKLTIISHLNPADTEGQRVYVYATQSPADESKFYTPDNLVVDVTANESNTTIRLDTILDNDKINFEIPAGFLKAGHKYSIYAFAPGFDIVQATTWIPTPSTISNFIIQDVRIEQSVAHEFKKIIYYKVRFNIDHMEPNRYYHLVFYNQYMNDPNLYIINPEPSDEQPSLKHYEYGILLDRDELVPNEALTFDFQDWIVNDNDLIRVYVELRSITAEYYKYYSSLTRQLIVRQDPFAEPVTIFNNIDGGYGNFSGFSPDITSSSLPQ